METTKLFLVLLVGIAVGAIGIYGAAMTGYFPRIAEEMELRSVGLTGISMEEHVRMAREVPMVAREAKEAVAIRATILELRSSGVLMANDEIFVQRAMIHSVDGEARSMEILVVSVIRDGAILSSETLTLRDALAAKDVLKNKMFIAHNDVNALLAQNAVLMACRADNLANAQLAFDGEALRVYSFAGIESQTPFGTSPGGNTQS